MRPLLPLLLLLAAAPVAAAQAPDSTATDSLPPGALSGTVADSLGGRPGALEGAEVWLDRSARTARTDRRGRFRIQGLPPGRYRVTFSHPRLDSVGVGAPVREVDVPPGGEATVALATPGTPTVIANLCGAIPDTSFGLVVGTVRDAVTGSPLPGVRVAARWRVTTIGTDGIRTEEEGAVSATGPDGLFVLCGVPADVAVLVRADSGAHATGLMEVYMAGRRVQGLDLAMARDDSVVADSGVAGGEPLRVGRARLQGTVRLENGRLAANARVAVLGTPATTRTDSTGAFRLGGLPSGSQSVEVRMIGYAPTWRGVLLRPDSTVRLEIVLDRAHELPSISIVGARANRLQRLPEFERRRRTGMGRYLTREQIEARNPIDVTDLFRTIPGVRVEWNGSDYVLLSSRGASLSGPCQIPIWLDGRPVLGDFPLDALVRPHDVEAIEVYSGSTVPAELGGLRAGCGAVVIWTRR